MNTPENRQELLFSEFEPVSPEQWQERIRKDLKDTDPETLNWQTYEGITVKPFYTRRDVEQLPFIHAQPGAFPFVRGHKATQNKWLNVPEIKVRKDSHAAILRAADALAKGADGILFNIQKPDAFDVAFLAEQIDLQQHFISYTLSDEPAEFLKRLNAYLEEKQVSRLGLKGFLAYDRHPVSLTYGSGDYRQLEKVLDLTKESPDFYGITVNGTHFANKGASLVQEIAFTLSAAVSYADKLTDDGIPLETVLRNLQFHLTAGTNYFFEIAKLRAIRLLWSAIVEAYQAEKNLASLLRIHVSTSHWYQTTFDPYVNLLRTTTEAMSAVIGGADSLSVEPFDNTYHKANAFSDRLARNISTILKEEAYLDKAADPAAGSYYIESLTNELAHKAWDLFREVEARGGFRKASQEGYISELLQAVSGEKYRNIAAGRDVLVGTNKYPNLQEKIDYDPEELIQSKEFDSTRAAYPFEVMRMATLLHQRKRQRKPKAIVVSIGEAIQRHINATFAREFFTCAGFDTALKSYNNFTEAEQELHDTAAEVMVLSASEKEFRNFAGAFAPSMKKHPDKPAIILAANPETMKEELKEQGFDDFIFQGCDTNEIITRIQQKLDEA